MNDKASDSGLSCLWQNQSESYLREVNQERLILDVTEDIWRLLDEAGYSKADLAEILGTSRPNITQLLNGSRNMTLRTLADIGYALKKAVNINFSDTVQWQSSGEQRPTGEPVSYATDGETITVCLFPQTGDLDAKKAFKEPDSANGGTPTFTASEATR